MTFQALSSSAAAVRRRLGVRVVDVVSSPTGLVTARAQLHSHGHVWMGWGVAVDADQAADIASAECIERWSQHAGADIPVVRGTYREFSPHAVFPPDVGLYSEAQYLRLSDRIARFDPNQVRSWTPVLDLQTGNERLVPLEIIRPGAPMPELPLVLETSSGTAVGTDAQQAGETAACEVLERDAALLWWHRRPPTPLWSHASVITKDPVTRLQAAGHVVILLRIDREIPVATVLAIVLLGRGVAMGLGTHPNAVTAAEHALGEVSADLTGGSPRRTVHRPLALVRTTADHRALYDHGPWHQSLRNALDDTIAMDLPEPPTNGQTAINALAQGKYTTLTQDLTPPVVRDCGFTVTRVVVPGLIPHYVGGNLLRLGCTRLTSRHSAGSFDCTLPHPFR